jgi:threonine dehydrogenase-like Zn-dependent dehydrogenase
VHAALGAAITAGDTVAVLGAGTLGLATVAALVEVVRPTTPCVILVGAKHSHQRGVAEKLGADAVVPPDQLPRAVRRESGSLVLGGRLTGGADVVFDCVGSAESLTQSMAMVRPRGRVVLVGMPGKLHVDLAPLWHREIQLVGAYAYGVETPGATGPAAQAATDPTAVAEPVAPARRTFAVAMDVVAAAGLGSLVSATYPLDRYEEAVAHAGAAGRRGAVKVAFDLRSRKGRPQ